jgi:hypothetical protein
MTRATTLASLLFAALAMPTSLAAQSADTSFIANILPSLEVARARGPIVVDGDLDDAGWLGAAAATNFSETHPGEKARPQVETVAKMTYDDDNLYIAFIAHDDPATIRATLHERDREFSEDLVGLILDPYGDATWAYEIFANALGVQGDLMWTNDNEDTGFDLVYSSAATITDSGYQVEMAIPFSSLRFPDRAEQTWRATFWRIHPRDSRREYSWAGVSRDNPCLFCQFGTITGIRDVHPGGALELLPAVVASQSSALRDPAEPAAGFEHGALHAEPSLGLRYAFSPSVAADVAINPDFSQVESDAGQIDVNSTFALFYPERRPFFQEGGDLFESWLALTYTRSINDPIAAAKLVGRAGRTSVAYIGAYDENTPIILPFEEGSALLQKQTKSLSNIVRAKQALGDNSSIGVTATDRRFEGGGSGSVVSADAALRFLDNYRLEVQLAASHTDEPVDTVATTRLGELRFDGDRYSATFDGEEFWGHALYVSAEREARTWGFDVDYNEYSPTFRAANGFVTQNDRRGLSGWTGYFVYPETDWLDRFDVSVGAARNWNSDWVRKDEFIRPAISLGMRAQTWVNAGFRIANERFRGVEFSGVNRFDIDVSSNFSSVASLGFHTSIGRYIARTLAEPVLGRGVQFDARGTFKPHERLIIQPNFWFQTLDDPNGVNVFEGYIVRLRSTLQFTRELFLRLVVQYDQFDDAFSIEPLLTYRINPFTAFYVGSTHAYNELGGESTGLTATSRQFFAKFQYLFRVGG